jgi:hypothetical protein
LEPLALDAYYNRAFAYHKEREFALASADWAASERRLSLAPRTDSRHAPGARLDERRPRQESSWRDGDLALASRGARASCDIAGRHDECPEALNDGDLDTCGPGWMDSWMPRPATPDGHWMEIQLPRPVPVAKAWICWAVADPHACSARDYDLEVWEGGRWASVVTVRQAAPTLSSHHAWRAVVTDRVRVHQLAGGGPGMAPNSLCVAEICLY